MTAKRQPITSTAVYGISSIGRIAFPSLHPTRSARLSEDFAAQYSAYGFPCQRLIRHLTMQSP
jgi:hypothetical protein